MIQQAASRLGKLILFTASGLVLCFATTSTDAATHSAFKKALQARYKLASVACTTCHLSDTERDQRNALGELFYKRLKDKRLTERFYRARKQGFEARRATEKVMTREFLQTLKNIEPLRTENGMTFGDRFRLGLFPGLKLRR